MQTHMNWHVEIIRLEGIGHVSKSLEGVAPAGLLKAKCNCRFAIFLWPKKMQYNVKKPLGLFVNLADDCNLFPNYEFIWQDLVPWGWRVCSSPEQGTWDISNHLWERRGGEGSDRRCDSCHHSRHTTADGPQQSHYHIPGTCNGPPGYKEQLLVPPLFCDVHFAAEYNTTTCINCFLSAQYWKHSDANLNFDTKQYTYFAKGSFVYRIKYGFFMFNGLLLHLSDSHPHWETWMKD